MGGSFSYSVVEVLPATNSDHKPLCLQFDSLYRVAPKLFRYEAKWSIDEECSEVVREVWDKELHGTLSLGSTGSYLARC
jgi:hypothetical protein